jgi:hypothetical protein
MRNSRFYCAAKLPRRSVSAMSTVATRNLEAVVDVLVAFTLGVLPAHARG